MLTACVHLGSGYGKSLPCHRELVRAVQRELLQSFPVIQRASVQALTQQVMLRSTASSSSRMNKIPKADGLTRCGASRPVRPRSESPLQGIWAEPVRPQSQSPLQEDSAHRLASNAPQRSATKHSHDASRKPPVASWSGVDATERATNTESTADGNATERATKKRRSDEATKDTVPLDAATEQRRRMRRLLKDCIKDCGGEAFSQVTTAPGSHTTVANASRKTRAAIAQLLRGKGITVDLSAMDIAADQDSRPWRLENKLVPIFVLSNKAGEAEVLRDHVAANAYHRMFQVERAVGDDIRFPNTRHDGRWSQRLQYLNAEIASVRGERWRRLLHDIDNEVHLYIRSSQLKDKLVGGSASFVEPMLFQCRAGRHRSMFAAMYALCSFERQGLPAIICVPKPRQARHHSKFCRCDECNDCLTVVDE